MLIFLFYSRGLDGFGPTRQPAPEALLGEALGPITR